MKVFRWAVLPAALACILLPAFRSKARPVEPDHPCYMQTGSGQTGQVVNLTALCPGKTVVIANPSVLLAPGGRAATTQQAANRDQVIETAREIQYGGNGTWILSGKVQNQTQQTISRVLLTLRIHSGAQMIMQNVNVDQASASPYGYLTFQATVTPTDKEHRPDFHVESAQWMNQDGSVSSYP